MKLNPIATFFLGVGYCYLAENPIARKKLITQLQKLSGMAIDTLNKQGDESVPEPEPPQEPEA